MSPGVLMGIGEIQVQCEYAISRAATGSILLKQVRDGEYDEIIILQKSIAATCDKFSSAEWYLCEKNTGSLKEWPMAAPPIRP